MEYRGCLKFIGLKRMEKMLMSNTKREESRHPTKLQSKGKKTQEQITQKKCADVNEVDLTIF